MPNLAAQLDLDVGLVRVSVEHDTEQAPKLPSAGVLAPGNRHYEVRLDEVLYAPASQEQQLLDALQPQITHREILQPWIFNAMIGQSIEWLRAKSEAAGSRQEQRQLRKATRTLEEFNALTVLFKRFQHALHRG